MDKNLIIPKYLFEEFSLKACLDDDYNSDDSYNWEEELLMEFQCEICMNYMFPPIKQCEIGHSYCQDCFGKVSSCPTCSSPKKDTRNFALEHIFEKLTFPCKYAEEGCLFQAKGPLVVSHQSDCSYKATACPLNSLKQCEWVGSKFNVGAHLKKSHDDLIFKNDFNVIISNFKCYSRTEKFCLVHAWGEIFYFSHVLTSGYFKAHIFRMTKFTNNDFKYAINFFKGDTQKKVISVEGPCKYRPTDLSSDFLPYFSWVVSYLAEFLDDDDCLHSSVQISIDN
ncbi:unnamed protein product [Brassicogethes aeneus]|uniref:RING-type E3 ubiquitin transferase n=1 Tax=Brassicogethes aeneus TaxID=1431903 RepID=A0A9P0FLA8_BRAAE|nr:unnamed protein product [Brassicogethes aeneus]